MKVPLSPLHTRRRPHKPLMAIFGLLSCIYVFVFCVFVFVICIFVFCEGRPGGGPTSHWCLSIALPVLESSNLIRNSFETRSGLHWHKIFYNMQINFFLLSSAISNWFSERSKSNTPRLFFTKPSKTTITVDDSCGLVTFYNSQASLLIGLKCLSDTTVDWGGIFLCLWKPNQGRRGVPASPVFHVLEHGGEILNARLRPLEGELLLEGGHLLPWQAGNHTFPQMSENFNQGPVYAHNV